MMEGKYNVTYKFKTSEVKTTEEKKEIFNKKLLNIILQIANIKLNKNGIMTAKNNEPVKLNSNADKKPETQKHEPNAILANFNFELQT